MAVTSSVSSSRTGPAAVASKTSHASGRPDAASGTSPGSSQRLAQATLVDPGGLCGGSDRMQPAGLHRLAEKFIAGAQGPGGKHVRAQEISERGVVKVIAVVMGKPVVQLGKDSLWSIVGRARFALQGLEPLEDGVCAVAGNLKPQLVQDGAILRRHSGLGNIFKPQHCTAQQVAKIAGCMQLQVVEPCCWEFCMRQTRFQPLVEG